MDQMSSGRATTKSSHAQLSEFPEVLSTTAVQRLTGLSRSALYFYIRQGLVPEPHRTEGGRLLFSRDHVEIPRRVVELRRQGQ